MMFVKTFTLFLLVLYLKICVGVLYELSTDLRNGYKYYGEISGYLKLHDNPTDWMSARLNCHSEDAVVASPWNAAFTSLIHKLQSTEVPMTHLHSGAEVVFREGVYKRNDKGQLYLSLDPSDIDGLGRCVAFVANGTTEQVGCEQKLPYLCYTPVHNTCGGSDTGYEFAPETGHCYKFIKFEMDWRSARQACLYEGAKLVVINSDKELQVIKSLHARSPRNEKVVSECCGDYVHVGAYYWNATGSWLTIHGQTLEQAGFSKWSSGYPKEDESFAAINRDGALVTLKNNKYAAVLCEKSQ